MASYNIPHISGNTYFVQDANAYASSAGVTYDEGDTGVWQITDPVTYTYSNHTWGRAISRGYTEVIAGSAQTFRQTINNDFASMQSQTDIIDDNLKNLDYGLADVAKTGSTQYMTDTTDRQFASATEKTYWNRKTWVDTSTSPATVYQGDTDITTAFQGLLTATIPSKTSDLTNDSHFIVGGSISGANIICSQNVPVSVYTTSAVETGSEFQYKFTIPLAGATTSMFPTVVFSETDAQSGDYAQVAECGTDCVYVWSRVTTSFTIPLVYAITPNTVVAVTP